MPFSLLYPYSTPLFIVRFRITNAKRDLPACGWRAPRARGPNIQEHVEVHDLCPFCIRDGLQTAGEKP